MKKKLIIPLKLAAYLAAFAVICAAIYGTAFFLRNYESHKSFTAGNTFFTCKVSQLPESVTALYICPFSSKETCVYNAEYWEQGSACLLMDKPLTDRDISALSKISAEKVHIRDVDKSLTDLSFLSKINGLKNLAITAYHLNGADVGKSIDFSNGFSELEQLQIITFTKKFSGIESLTSLKRLTLPMNPELTELPDLTRMTELEVLDISGTSVSDLSPISECKKLRELYIYDTDISDISVLTPMTDLEILNAAQHHDHSKENLISDISALANKPKLREIDLYCTDVSDITPLSSCKALEAVRLAGTAVSDITPLSSCKALESVGLSDTPITTLAPLMNCPKLCSVRINNCDNLTYSQVEEFDKWYQSLDHDVYY